MAKLADIYNRYDGPIPDEVLESLPKTRTIRDELAAMTRAERLAYEAREAEQRAKSVWADMRHLCRRNDRFNIGLIQAHRMHMENGSVFGRREWMRLREELATLLRHYHAERGRAAVNRQASLGWPFNKPPRSGKGPLANPRSGEGAIAAGPEPGQGSGDTKRHYPDD